MALHEHSITTTNGASFTAQDHGALARLVFKRFGEDLASATAAWRRLLENGATESDFSEILTWGATPEPAPPDPVTVMSLVAWKGLRQLSLETLHAYLAQMCFVGFISRIEITGFDELDVTGNVTVESLSEGTKTHRFYLHLGSDFTSLRAFGRSKRFR